MLMCRYVCRCSDVAAGSFFQCVCVCVCVPVCLYQAWIPLLMVLTPEDVSKIRFGRKLTEEWYVSLLSLATAGLPLLTQCVSV